MLNIFGGSLPDWFKKRGMASGYSPCMSKQVVLFQDSTLKDMGFLKRLFQWWIDIYTSRYCCSLSLESHLVVAINGIKTPKFNSSSRSFQMVLPPFFLQSPIHAYASRCLKKMRSEGTPHNPYKCGVPSEPNNEALAFE